MTKHATEPRRRDPEPQSPILTSPEPAVAPKRPAGMPATTAAGKDVDPRIERGSEVMGDDYVENGAACDRPTRDEENCFYSGIQRARIVERIDSRITAATLVFSDAVNIQRVKNYLDTEQPSAIGLMIIGLMTGYIGGLITSSLVGLQSGGLGAWDGPTRQMFNNVSKDSLKLAVSTTIGAGKKQLEGLVKKGVAHRSRQQDRELFLQQLLQSVVDGFAALNLRASTEMNDAELVVLCESFDKKHHSHAIYEKRVEEQLARYSRSAVPEIGENYTVGRAQHGDTRDSYRYVCVAWFRFLSGYPRQLAFMHSKHGRRVSPENLGLAQGQTSTVVTEKEGFEWGSGGGKDRMFVPDELVEVALQRHRSTYGAEPPTLYVDDRSWTWDPPRAEAARKNWEKLHREILSKVKNPFAGSAPGGSR